MHPLGFVTRALAATALGLSCWLWWLSASTEPAVGCGFASFDCDTALASPWAKWLGLPVAAGGTLCYAAALTGAALAPRRDAGWRLLEFAAPLAVGAGAWFVAIQAIQLDAYCLWCLLTHAGGAGMAAAAFAWRSTAAKADRPAAVVTLGAVGVPIVPTRGGPPALGAPTALALLGVASLGLGQFFAAPPSAVQFEPTIDAELALNEPPPPRQEASPATPAAGTAPTEPKAPAARRAGGSRELSLLRGRLRIDAYDHPVLGSPDAPHLVVELMDYACPHCREFHTTLLEALARFDGQIGVVVMPVPGEKTCNPYVAKARKQSTGACYAARLSVAVARLEPSRFEAFHAWMLEADSIPLRTSALLEARRHVEEGRLAAALRDPDGEINARVRQYVELARAISQQGRLGFPAQVLGNRVVAGPPGSVDKLCEVWAESFDLELPTADVPF